MNNEYKVARNINNFMPNLIIDKKRRYTAVTATCKF